jgi:hypothetical protein
MQPFKMQPIQVSSALDFSSVADSKNNNSISVGGGYSSSGGWNVNATYTKRW